MTAMPIFLVRAFRHGAVEALKGLQGNPALLFSNSAAR